MSKILLIFKKSKYSTITVSTMAVVINGKIFD